ncbi:uncharacterized protein DUF4019 [Luteibacter rhizovicinus]|uniref:Uncharacterized protein DUF4019 n=1 Tax=Luteibacter rhizovicinus TaxID=242606 RepID=A0A4R3YJQ0_9GAMM|nr:DUF4019 domain-containing protein [Luteibacter rhizovicinus]TCV91608.1 uncharacterized protein DUF4019 [Luteibacter rhizovicinus]
MASTPSRGYAAVDNLGKLRAMAEFLTIGPGADTPVRSIDGAIGAATRWVELSDTHQAEAMWQAADDMMRQLVPLADWVRYLIGVRAQLGRLRSRDWFEIVRVCNPNGLPAGDYLNVVFHASYRQGAVYETISLAPTPAGWSPVGYVIRPVQPDTMGYNASSNAI